MTIVGVDLSLKSSGICLKDSNGNIHYLNIVKKLNKIARKLDNLKNVYVTLPPQFENELSQAEVVANTIIDFVKEHKSDGNVIFVFERPVANFTGGSTNCTLQLHTQSAIVRYLVEKEFGENITIMFSPTHVKKIFTGRGNSKKDGMLFKFQELKNIKDCLYQFCQNHKKAETNVNDLIDAFAIVYTYEKEKEEYDKRENIVGVE